MGRLTQLAEFRTDRGDSYRPRGIQEMKRSGKTKQTVVMCRMFLLIGRRGRAAIGLMQAKRGNRKIIKGGSLGQLWTDNSKQ